MKIIPEKGRLLLREFREEIAIGNATVKAEAAQTLPAKGEIIAVGDGSDYKVGERVIASEFEPVMFTFNGEKLYILDESMVRAKIQE